MGKEDLCVVLTASLGMGGWSEKRRGSWWDTRAPRLRLSGRHALRVCGEVVRRGVVLWLDSRAPARDREGENEGECMEVSCRGVTSQSQKGHV